MTPTFLMDALILMDSENHFKGWRDRFQIFVGLYNPREKRRKRIVKKSGKVRERKTGGPNVGSPDRLPFDHRRALPTRMACTCSALRLQAEAAA